MARIAISIDWGAEHDPGDELERAREALTFGGSRETALEIRRPGFGAVVLAHGSRFPVVEREGSILIGVGHCLWEGDEVAFLEAIARWIRDEAGPPPALRSHPLGRCSLVRWNARERELVIAGEPHGLAPLHLLETAGRLWIASEPKAVLAMTNETPRLDPDALRDLFVMGECVGSRTLVRDLRVLPPGTAARFVPGARSERPWHVTRFADRFGGEVRPAAEAMNASLLEILAAERRSHPRVTVALSGGMDSRYLLAGALHVWEKVEALSFGPENGGDAIGAREVTRAVGVPHVHVAWDGPDLARWTPYGIWRSDGMQTGAHQHGMNALIARADQVGLVLCGMGGDLLTGAFLRPTYLLRRGTPENAARTLLARAAFLSRPLDRILKPEVLRACGSSTEEALLALLRERSYGRLGNALIDFWVRRHCPRLTVLGIELESPMLEYATPLADPRFVATAAAMSLEQRFLGRAYRRALARLEPRLMEVSCERYGCAPRRPWPVLALHGAARRLGLAHRTPWPVSYTEGHRRPVRGWFRDLLLDPETAADGFLQPSYLRDLVEDQATGRADHALELGAAIGVELWRRIVLLGRADLARPPLDLPRPGAPMRFDGDTRDAFPPGEEGTRR